MVQKKSKLVEKNLTLQSYNFNNELIKMILEISEKPNFNTLKKNISFLMEKNIKFEDLYNPKIMNLNTEQFAFLIALNSFQGKDFKKHFSLIKQYVNQRELSDDQLIKFENLLYEHFLKNYESESAYNYFFNFFSKSYKSVSNKKFITNKKNKKLKSILFFVIAPSLLAHTVPLFNMLRRKKEEYKELEICIASLSQNKKFSEKCFECNAEFISIEGNTISNKLDNLNELSKKFEYFVWVSTPTLLSYFSSRNTDVCYWSHKFHPNFKNVSKYIGAFPSKSKIVFVNDKKWNNINIGFNILNIDQSSIEHSNRSKCFGSFCREELIDDEKYWLLIKSVLENNDEVTFYYCGRSSIHHKWCKKLKIDGNKIKFLGWLKEPHLKIKEMCFLIDGFNLGHGYLAMEAMAAKVPIIYPKSKKGYSTCENLVKYYQIFYNEINDDLFLNFDNENFDLICHKLFYDEGFNNYVGLYYEKVIKNIPFHSFEDFYEILKDT